MFSYRTLFADCEASTLVVALGVVFILGALS